MMEKRKILIGMVVVAFSVFLATTTVAAAAKTHEDIYSAMVQKTPMKEPTRNPLSFDAFTIAFMGLSLGCMLVAAGLHWSLSQRHYLENQIKDLDTFLAASSCVSLRMSSVDSASPMVNIARGAEENRRSALQACAKDRETLINTISAIEADIVRMWG